jgi:hypothetical protein
MALDDAPGGGAKSSAETHTFGAQGASVAEERWA